MEIHIKTMPHSAQAYETVGNYWYDQDGVLQIRVSDMKNKRFEVLVAIHELVEQFITECNGIAEQDITDFDLAFESARKLGLRMPTEEPGFAESAPYRLAHSFATGIELAICGMTGINWTDYDNTVNSL